MKYIAFILTILSGLTFADVTLVKVEKSLNKMYLFDGNTLIKEYHVVFGANPKGHKQMEGDERTPEGMYILDYKKENSTFYRAMHVSYPNKMDKENAKNLGVDPGGLIMVHGQRNGFGLFSQLTQKFNWTNGCIALTNREMDEFMDLVKVGTPIQIIW